jgi:hypothetical protein
MKTLFLTLAVLCAIAFVLTFPLQSTFRGKAKMIQRIEKSASGDMFGDEGTPIGVPMMQIIEDEKAFIGPADSSGTYKVDEHYLSEHKIHPLQLKTVDFLASISRLGFVLSTILLSIISWKIKPKVTVVDGS